MNILIDLFLTFARIGVCTFGGGYAMLPILQRELVENKKWATENELADYYAVGQCTPGVIAVNTSTFVGRSKGGAAGGIIATMGLVFPTLVIIMVIAAFLQNFMHLEFVSHAFNGVRAGVVALILSSVIKLFKNAVIDWPTRAIFAVVLLLAAAGSFITLPETAAAGLVTLWNIFTSPVFLVVAAGVAGLAVRAAKGGLRK